MARPGRPCRRAGPANSQAGNAEEMSIARHVRHMRFRRSPALVCYWAAGEFVFENFVTGARVAAHPLAAAILHSAARWATLEKIAAHFPGYTRASLSRAVAQLAAGTLLERSDRASPPEHRALEQWKDWNPHAGFFHFSTKHTAYAEDDAAVMRELRRRARRQPVPPAVRPRRGIRSVPLPAPHTAGEFPQVLLARRTWREFAARPLALGELATLLGLTWGVQRWLRVRGLGRFALKTSPSGGALHPIEVYVVARRVAGLPPGLYHYAAHRHRLELLRRGAAFRQTASYVPGQPWFARAAALFLMTAVFARPQWKYRSPRAYRAVLTEAGHFCQTFCLTSTWLGLAPFCTLALADARIEAALGVDGVRESVLYAAGVGARPPGGDALRSLAPWLESS